MFRRTTSTSAGASQPTSPKRTNHPKSQRAPRTTKAIKSHEQRTDNKSHKSENNPKMRIHAPNKENNEEYTLKVNTEPIRQQIQSNSHRTEQYSIGKETTTIQNAKQMTNSHRSEKMKKYRFGRGHQTCIGLASNQIAVNRSEEPNDKEKPSQSPISSLNTDDIGAKQII